DRAHALADFLLEVRFAQPVGGDVTLGRDGLSVDTATQDGCPAAPRAPAGEGPGDARLVASLPLYGLAQRQCSPRRMRDVRVPLAVGRPLDLTRALGWLIPTRLAVRGGALSISASV